MLTCPHCGKEFDEKPKPKGKWYYSNYWVIFAVLCAGPFALPLIWFNPNYKTATKWIASITIIIATVLIIFLFIFLIGILIEQFRQLANIS
ncbi:MAG: hypothetical protein ABFD79_13185 [Phycisphaerales bacterium]